MTFLPSSARATAAAAFIALPLVCATPALGQAPGDTSPDGLWTFFEGVTLPADYSPPTEFAIARLAAAEMARVLLTAPPENPSAPEDPAALFLPLPDLTFEEVGAQSAMLMERSLAAMPGFDEIATYRFGAFGRLPLGGHILVTPSMFVAVGYSDGDLLRIEPITTPDGDFHIVYFESDRTDGLNDFVHVMDESGEPEDIPILERGFPALDPDFDPPIPPVSIKKTEAETLLNLSVGPAAAELQALAAEQPIDGSLRVFRLAATTTGEFYQANDLGGGDVDVVISLILRLLAVNAVFEPEIGVRLTLAASTLNVLFDDPNTDPFNAGATPCQFRDVQPFVALFFLPVASYDLGFLFANGGGGGCAWYVVCEDAAFEKARGSGKFGDGTGLGTGLLLHEVGHQLGSRHTYSGLLCDLPNFDGDNGTVPSAYAPGSGSTIMSYLGSCGADDVDTTLNPAGTYYHIKSIEQISNELTLGVGATCGAMLDFGNSPPDVDAGPDYTIPRNTPFTLQAASAIDPDGDPVSVTWEQVDLTTQRRSITFDAGDNPIIRSVQPSGFLDRTIPDIRDILDDLDLAGELLPQQDRTVNFRAIARDNQLAGGGVAYDDMVVTAQGLPFFVTQPSTAATWHAGCMENVEWFQGGSTDNNGPNTDFVDIFYSSTGGLEPGPDPVRQSFPTTIVAGTANDSLYQMSVPCAATAAGRLKVMASDNIFFDVNDQNLIVVEELPVVVIPAIAPGVVNEQCEFTVEFSATVTDDCGVAAGDVSVDVAQTSFNYTLGAPNVNVAQNGAGQVDVSGSVLVSDLQSSPATLRITVDGLDNCSFMGTSFQNVSVADETPPEIDVTVAPENLWPPNHKMETITANVVATDNCSNVTVALDSIVSDEPDNGTGIGDGNTVDDIQNAAFGTEDLFFDLRRERDRQQNGRTYTITYEAKDGSNNTATDVAIVHVAHDQN